MQTFRPADGSNGLPFNPEALAGLRVLVIDDEADARDLLTIVLQAHGAEVRAAGSAIDGWSVLDAWTPHVIMSDIGMPRIDGYEFIEKVRSEGTTIPAAALTAYTRPSDRQRALTAGFQAHMPKPAEPSELVALIASLAGRAASDAASDS